ncbi:DUF362 domain-containing protein [Crassaminicella profunda]|uniref:DUF362 domain-containing protein n=1 Tax=Crassaminicella profunda TaxID=1286698 RepID=UPI001CA6043E|nr:DUF362 domain-containing protein [Crassaminicella profunda]QZY54957.1 DUF362 domain-containing protein [Crassaminicella profunda]
MDRKNIHIIYGDNPKEMVKNLLKDANIVEEINRNALIGLKPNLVVAKKASSGATTTPEIVEGLIEYLHENGRKNIVIIEGSWVGDRTSKAFKVCGYDEISKKYNVPLYDLQKDSYHSYSVEGMNINVCEKAMEVDYLINLPVFKGHCQTKMTCSLKNMKGCIPDTEKRKFHSRGLHKPIAYLNRILKQDLIIVDGLNGDLTFEEGGTPVKMDRILLGKDPVLMDSYICELMGYKVEDVPYITQAENIGVGTCDVENAVIKELNQAKNRIDLSANSGTVERLTKNVQAESACSACYGSLVHALNRIEEKGQLNKIKEKIYIGQGFKGKEGKGIGIGMCTKGFSKCIKGCPPKAIDIIEGILEK